MTAMIELPLILFTLLVQLGVGVMLSVQILPPPTALALRGQSFFAFCFTGAAAIISLAHLGVPPNTPLVMLNFSSSWLSLQIISVIVLCCCLAWLAWLRKRHENHEWENFLAWIAVALGIWLLFVMSRVYSSPLLPRWQGCAIFFLFLASALMLGAMWVAMALARTGFSGNGAHVPSTYGRLLFLALGGLVLIATFTPLALPALQTGPISRSAVASAREGIALWHSWHGALSGLGVLIFMTGLYRRVSKAGVNADLTIPGLPIMGFAFTFAMLGELCGRVAYYLSYVRL